MDSDTAQNKERMFLIVSSSGNLLVAVVGVTCALISASQAILLDGLFNLTYCATGLFTLKVARLVAAGDDDRFPHGYAFFEPLVNGIKGVLVLGISVMAIFGAVQAILAGGRPIAAGLATGYGIFASLTCGLVAWVTWRGTREVQKPACAG